jgi:hypothetical protein
MFKSFLQCQYVHCSNFWLILLLFIYLNCKWVFTQWQCTIIRHNTQITHHTQTITAHKTTQTIKNFKINKRIAITVVHFYVSDIVTVTEFTVEKCSRRNIIPFFNIFIEIAFLDLHDFV